MGILLEALKCWLLSWNTKKCIIFPNNVEAEHYKESAQNFMIVFLYVTNYLLEEYV